MLIGSISALSLVLALAVCLGCGAFAALSWLWVLPLSFLGIWVMLAILAFLFLWFVASRVDKEQVQEHDDPFYREMVKLYVPALMWLVKSKLHATGLEKTPKDGRFLLVCNHLSIADPGYLLDAFREKQIAFISKQENKDMFIIGSMMHKILCQTLDRDNDRQALRVILRCVDILKNDEASIGVFPEGYTSKDGKLHHFRAGAFKIAQKANVPIVVCTIRNTDKLFKNLRKFKTTHVELHLVDVIPAEELKGCTTADISRRVYDMMYRDLGPEYTNPEENT